MVWLGRLVTKICVELAIVPKGVPPAIVISNRNSVDNPYAKVAEPRSEITNMPKIILLVNLIVLLIFNIL